MQRKFKSPSEAKLNCKTRGLRRHCSDIVSQRGSLSCVASRSPSPSRHVSWCQSFAEKPVAQPLPLPGLHPGNAGCIDTEIRIPAKYWSEKSAKSSLPLPRSACIRSKANQGEIDGYLIAASVSKEGSSDSDDPADFSEQSPPATDCGRKGTTTAFSPSRLVAFFTRVYLVKCFHAYVTLNRKHDLKSPSFH